MQHRTPIFFVVSPRARVGKTLIARLLVEYFRVDERPPAAFDVNPDEFALVDHLPALTAVASIEDTRGQMALFDQLVEADDTPKVVDISHVLFERFFQVMLDTGFADEVRGRPITPVALFIADPDKRSAQAYRTLQRRLPELAIVPVFNDAVSPLINYRDNFPPAQRGGPPITIAALSPVVKGVLERPSFSFSNYTAKTADTTTELHSWIRNAFVQFRELELRLLLEALRPSLKFSA